MSVFVPPPDTTPHPADPASIPLPQPLKVPTRSRRRKRRQPWRALRQSVWGASPAQGPPPSRRARLGGVARRHLLPLGCYGLITAVMTWPLVSGFGNALVGNGFDAWQNLWNFWWTRTALERRENPFQTPFLYAPDGAPLYLHTLNLFNGLVSLPFQRFGNLIAAYNAVVIVSFVLAAYFASLLVARVSGSARVGFVGGLIYGFSAYHLNHLYYGQTNLLASEWLPAYALCLLCATEAVGRRRTLLVVASALSLFFLVLSDWQYVVFALLFTGVWVVYATIARRDGRAIVVAAAIGFLWLLLALPILLPTVTTLRVGITAFVKEEYLVQHSADLLSLVVSGSRQRWWQALTARSADLGAVATYAQGEYLGFVPLLLAASGVLLAWRRARFWLLVALGGCLLALGPLLQVAGRQQFGASGWTVPLPYRLLAALPGLSIARIPTRYTLVATLALAVLTGLGLVALGQRLAGRIGGAVRVALTVALGALILGEQMVVPYPSEAVQAPAFARQLAAEPGEGTVLVVPFSFEEPRALYWQTIHRRPMIAGYLSRPVNDPLLLLPPFHALVNQRTRPDIVAPDPPALAGQALAFAQVRWVVVDLAHAQPDREPLASFMAQQVESAPLYADRDFAVYRTLAVPASPDSPLAARIGPGWYEPEPLVGTPDRMRWLDRSGTIHAWNLGTAPEAATIRFTAWSFRQPQRLEIRLDGQLVDTRTIVDLQTVTLPVTLTPGRHQLELRAFDPPTRPVDLGLGRDPRPLSIGVACVTIGR